VFLWADALGRRVERSCAVVVVVVIVIFVAIVAGTTCLFVCYQCARKLIYSQLPQFYGAIDDGTPDRDGLRQGVGDAFPGAGRVNKDDPADVVEVYINADYVN
jgi:hypothetical protein